jgi:hypothetical protein
MMEQIYKLHLEIWIDAIELGKRVDEKSCSRSRRLRLYPSFDSNSEEAQICKVLAGRGELGGSDGFLSARHNCSFSTLFQIYGIDLLTFLLDRPWVPAIMIYDPSAELFCKRVQQLTTALHRAKEGTSLPLPTFAPPYSLSAERILDKPTREIAELSLREIADFGAVCRYLQSMSQSFSIGANIEGPYENGSVMAHASDTGKCEYVQNHVLLCLERWTRLFSSGDPSLVDVHFVAAQNGERWFVVLPQLISAICPLVFEAQLTATYQTHTYLGAVEVLKERSTERLIVRNDDRLRQITKALTKIWATGDCPDHWQPWVPSDAKIY